MKNALFNLLLSLGPKKKFFRKDIPRILVVSTTALGDSLWGSPAIRALRKKHPNGYIALLTSPIGKELFQNNPNVDELFVVKNPAVFSAFKLLPTLRKKQFDTAYIFHVSQRPILPIISLAGPSKVVGTIGINKGLDHLLTDAIASTHPHEIERRLRLVGCANASAHMELFLTEEEKGAAQNHGVKAALLVGLHPGSNNRFTQWNPNHFIQLGKTLAKEKNATVFITGSPSEIPLAEEIAKQIPGAISLAGKLSVRALAAFIARLHLFVTNDTGPMHLSLAMKTPTCCLFAPSDPANFGPYKVDHGIIIKKPRTCSPCIRKRCGFPFCMEQISPSMVYDAIHAYLSRHRPTSHSG